MLPRVASCSRVGAIVAMARHQRELTSSVKLAIKLPFYSKLPPVRCLAQRRQHGRRGREAVGEQRSAGHASKVLTGGSASLLPAASRSRLAY